jgi:hypothetical protein
MVWYDVKASRLRRAHNAKRAARLLRAVLVTKYGRSRRFTIGERGEVTAETAHARRSLHRYLGLFMLATSRAILSPSLSAPPR